MAASLAESSPSPSVDAAAEAAEEEEVVESSLGSATEISAASCCCWWWSPCIIVVEFVLLSSFSLHWPSFLQLQDFSTAFLFEWMPGMQIPGEINYFFSFLPFLFYFIKLVARKRTGLIKTKISAAKAFLRWVLPWKIST